jgi:DNA-directed RNA polymerase specialized sigma subunit
MPKLKRNANFDLELEKKLFDVWHALLDKYQIENTRHVQKLPLYVQKDALCRLFLNLRYKVIKKHEGWIVSTLDKERFLSSEHREDTYQEIVKQLLNDINNFNPYQEVAFTSFFKLHVRGACIRSFYANVYALTPPSVYLKAKNKIVAYQKKHNCSIKDACIVLNIKYEVGLRACNANYIGVPLSVPN